MITLIALQCFFINSNVYCSYSQRIFTILPNFLHSSKIPVSTAYIAINARLTKGKCLELDDTWSDMAQIEWGDFIKSMICRWYRKWLFHVNRCLSMLSFLFSHLVFSYNKLTRDLLKFPFNSVLSLLFVFSDKTMH